jgi:6-phosphogluconolactonase
MAPSRRSPGATRPLSAAETDPAQIGFNKEGTVLLVTENATSRLTTYTVNPDGIPNAPQSRPAALPTPFGFQFGDRHVVFVSQANPGNPGAVSSYLVPETGEVSTAIDTLTAENAACWVALSSDQTVGYTTNTGSASISLFRIRFDGALDPFFLRERTIPTGNGPIDLVITQDGRNLYTLNAVDNRIRTFTVRPSGDLARHGDLAVPAGANGLAAR